MNANKDVKERKRKKKKKNVNNMKLKRVFCMCVCKCVCASVCVYLTHREALARKLFKLSMKLKHSFNCYIHMFKML